MINGPTTFWRFAFKVVVVHTGTYFAFGLILSQVLDYGHLFEQEIIREFMRPIDSPYVFAGPFLQPLRGLLFAVGLWPIWTFIWNILILRLQDSI